MLGPALQDRIGRCRVLTPRSANWTTPVVLISGLGNTGLDELWQRIREHRKLMTASGEFVERRKQQAVNWMHDMLLDRLRDQLYANPRVAERLPLLEAMVGEGEMTPALAVEEVMKLSDRAAAKRSG